MNEIDKLTNEIHDSLMEWYNKGLETPKYFILPLEHRQALKLSFAISLKEDPTDYPELVKYMGVPILKKEEVMIL